MGAVVFQFQAQGQKDIENAFKNIATASSSAAKSVVKDADLQVKALEKVTKAAAKSSKETANELVSSSKSATDKIIADFDRQANAAERAGERMERALAKVGGKKGGLSTIGQVAAGYITGNLVTSAMNLAKEAIGTAARDALKLQELSTTIAVAGRGYGQGLSDPTAIRKSLEATALATPGVTSEDVGAGVHQFIARTGRADIASQMQGTFATTASATGSKVEEIANAAADLFEKFDIKTIDEMQHSFAMLTFQGKKGAFELKDAAGQYGKLAAAASRFNIGTGIEAVATLGGLTQISRRANSSPEEAATAVERMFSHLIEHSTKLKAQGVNVFDKSGGSRNIQDILVETIMKVGKGDFGAKKVGLEKIFGERGIRAISPMISISETAYNDAKAKGKTATEALAIAEKTLRDYLEENINTQASWSEVQKDASTMQQTASSQLTEAWEKVKEAAGENLTKSLTDLAPAAIALVPAFKLILEALGGFASALATLSSLIKPANEYRNTGREAAMNTKSDALQKQINERLANPEHQEYDLDNDPVLNRLYAEQDQVLAGGKTTGVLSKEEMIEKLVAVNRKNYVKPEGLLADYNDPESAWRAMAETAVGSFSQNHKTSDIRGFDNLNPEQKDIFADQRDIYEAQNKTQEAYEAAMARKTEAANDAAEKINGLATAAERAMDAVAHLPLSEMNR